MRDSEELGTGPGAEDLRGQGAEEPRSEGSEQQRTQGLKETISEGVKGPRSSEHKTQFSRRTRSPTAPTYPATPGAPGAAKPLGSPHASRVSETPDTSSPSDRSCSPPAPTGTPGHSETRPSAFLPLRPLSPSALFHLSPSNPEHHTSSDPKQAQLHESLDHHSVNLSDAETPDPSATHSLGSKMLQALHKTGFGHLQILNLLAFSFQLLMLQMFGRNIGKLSDKYQTFVTPASYAFSIWGLIYTAEAINTVYQLLPSQRSPNNPFVQRISWFAISAQVLQAGWAVTWSYELIELSLVFMLGIYLSLATLHWRLDSVNLLAPKVPNTGLRSQVSWKDWALYYLPFQLHFGWITAATVISLNTPLRAQGLGFEVQFGAAASSLGLVLVSAFFNVVKRRDIVHSLVLTWALLALGIALRSPTRTSLPFNSVGKPYTLALGFGAWINCGITSTLSLLGGLWAAYELTRGGTDEHQMDRHDLLKESEQSFQGADGV